MSQSELYRLFRLTRRCSVRFRGSWSRTAGEHRDGGRLRRCATV